MHWIVLFILAGCSIGCDFEHLAIPGVASTAAIDRDSIPLPINPSGNTVETRFPAPEGFARLPATANTFASYLRQLPLHPDGYAVHLFNGQLKNYQEAHCAVINLDIGSRDLQQCADAVIRLRAEYLYAQKRYSDIHFNFTNGFRAEYARWRAGERIRVDENRVYWVAGGSASGSYAAFRQYLDMVFAYAGTASLERELQAVEPDDLQPGDVWIKGGHPGHAVLVLDVALHPETGERRFLLAQSYMPAQEIHVLKNSGADQAWYSMPDLEKEGRLITPEWIFEKGQLRRFAN